MSATYFDRVYAGSNEQRRPPTFRIYCEGELRHAVCEDCEMSNAGCNYRFVDKIEYGWMMLRLNMAQHASEKHTHR